MFVFFKFFNSNTKENLQHCSGLQRNIEPLLILCVKILCWISNKIFKLLETYKMFRFKNILLTIRTFKEIRREPWASFKII